MQIYQEQTLKRPLIAENFPPKIGTKNHILFGLSSKGQASSLLGHPENSSQYHPFYSRTVQHEHAVRGEVMDTISVSVYTFEQHCLTFGLKWDYPDKFMIGDMVKIGMEITHGWISEMDAIIQSYGDKLTFILQPDVMAFGAKVGPRDEIHSGNILFGSIYEMIPTYANPILDDFPLPANFEITNSDSLMCNKPFCFHKNPCRLHECFLCSRFVLNTKDNPCFVCL